MPSYTKDNIILKLKENGDIEKLYNNKIINYLGKTMDTKEKYTEVLAENIVNNLNVYDFEKITELRRNSSYNISHTGEYKKDSPRREEIIAMKMYNSNTFYGDIGKIINYQIPLKNVRTDKAGKIDLISYNDKSNTLYLIELKNDESRETLLRCTLEIITYLKKVCKSKLIEDYNLPKDTKVVPAILIFDNTRPYEDINDKYVNSLIKKFNIKVFVAKSEETFKIKGSN